MAAILKIPQLSRQLQSEYRSINYSMRQYNDVFVMQISANWLSSVDVKLSL